MLLTWENVVTTKQDPSRRGSAFQLSNITGFYPSVRVDWPGAGVVSQAGGLILTDTVHFSGIGAGLSEALSPWRKPFAVPDPRKILTDLRLSSATGGDCLADVDRLRSQPQVYGWVASDAAVSRLVTTLSTIAPTRALAVISTARAAARSHVWELAGDQSPLHGASKDAPLIVDLDATLLTSHSEKEDARPRLEERLRVPPAGCVRGPRG